MMTTIREDEKTVRCFFTNKNEFKKIQRHFKELGLNWITDVIIWKRADYEVVLHFI